MPSFVHLLLGSCPGAFAAHPPDNHFQFLMDLDYGLRVYRMTAEDKRPPEARAMSHCNCVREHSMHNGNCSFWPESMHT